MISKVCSIAIFSLMLLMTCVSDAQGGLDHSKLGQLLAQRISLTSEESAWLDRAPTIRFRVAENSPEQFFENGVAAGLSVDYAKIICATYGLRCEFVPYLGGQFSQALEKLGQTDGPDVMLTGRTNAEREKLALFTSPYLFTPSVIVTRDTAPNIFSLADLENKKVVIERGYLIGKLLQDTVPGIQLIAVDTTPKALETLAGGIGDAYVGNLTTSTFIAAKFNLANLKIAAPTNFPIQGESMMLRRDWPELVSLIDKVFASLTPAEKQRLQDHWYSLKFDDGGWRSYGILISIAAAILALALAAFLLWNLQLRIRAQRAANQMQRLEKTLPGALYEYVTHNDGIGEFRYFSDSVKSLLGLSPQDLMGSANLLTHRIHPEDLPKFLNAVRQSTETGKPFFIESRIQAADGSWRWIQTSAATQGDDHRSATWSGFMLDITERKQLEHATDRMTIVQQENEAIARLLKEKEHVVATMLNENRNASTSALSASIAHQLNQPLGASSLNIQFLKRQLERNELSPSLGREILDNLDDDNQRAANIIQALRVIFLDGTPPPSPIDFNEQIQAVLSVVRPAISQSNIALSFQFSAGLRVAIHQSELQKVLLNLINNAIEALNTHEDIADPSFCKILTLSCVRNGDNVQFTVTDNGMGIPEQKIKGLFELITSDENEPAGLGLWLCQHIIHRYGGKIWHEQPGGTGSRFVIELPIQNN